MEEHKHSELPMAFPPYRRSHFRSQTYNTLVRIFSHLPPSTIVSIDNDNGGKGQENEEKEPVGSDVMDPNGSIPLKEIHEIHDVRETVESVEHKSVDFSVNDMVDLDDLMGSDEPSAQTNDFHLDQTLMDELKLIVKGTENPVCDDGLIPLNCEKQCSVSEVELMDYQVEDVEFLHCGTNTSGIVSELQSQLPGELNQLVSEGFHVSESTKGIVSISVISTSSVNNESQQEKEPELAKPVSPFSGSFPTVQEGEFEKEDMYGHKVDEAFHNSLDLDTNSEALNMNGDVELVDSTSMKDKKKTQNEDKSEKLICVTNASNSLDILIEEGYLEEGEISGDFVMDGNTFDVSSADADLLKSNAIEDASSNGQVEPKTINAIPTNLTQNQVLHKGFMEETSIKVHENSSVVQQMVDASGKEQSGPGPKKKKNNKEVIDDSKKRKGAPDSEEEMVDASRRKHGPVSEEKKNRKRKKYRMKRAQKNRELGVKRLTLIPVQKPKTISYCRHYMKGRCNEGDKCNFSHDIVPSTKSKACVHFARHSCMKGDDCPYDHQLSKYPCSNFVSKGSCNRGPACLFSHQVLTNQDIPTPSNACKPESKSPISSGSRNFSTPLNSYGRSSMQQNNSTTSKGINSHTTAEHKVTVTSQTQPTSAPKGIRFINIANLSPSAPKQDMVTPNNGSLVRNGTCADKGQNSAEKKFPAVTPKGINFLSFSKGSVCSFNSSIQSILEGKISKLPQSVNFGLSEPSISSLNKNDYSKVSDKTTQNLPQTSLFSREIIHKNQSMAERLKSKFIGKDSTDNFVMGHSRCESVQEVKNAPDNSQTSAMLLACPLVSHQSSEYLVSGYHKQAPNLSQRAHSSTLAFAAEHESNIKLKCPPGTSV